MHAGRLATLFRVSTDNSRKVTADRNEINIIVAEAAILFPFFLVLSSCPNKKRAGGGQGTFFLPPRLPVLCFCFGTKKRTSAAPTKQQKVSNNATRTQPPSR